MVVSEYVAAPLKGANVKRYEALGYIIPRRIDKQGRNLVNVKSSLLVKVKDLPHGSDIRIDVMCDYCGSIKSMQYKNYTIQKRKDVINKDCCVKCRYEKIKESNLKIYGVENPMELERFRKKQNDSNRADIGKVKEDFEKMGFIPLFDEYTHDKEDLPCRCKKHLDILQTKKYGSIKVGEGCRYCSASKGEMKVQKCLNSNNIRYTGEMSFDSLLGVGGLPLRFDFAVFNGNGDVVFLIEYDGIFHFEKQFEGDGFDDLQVHDERKNQYCKDNNIPLLRVPYWEFDNIKGILEEWLSKHALI